MLRHYWKETCWSWVGVSIWFCWDWRKQRHSTSWTKHHSYENTYAKVSSATKQNTVGFSSSFLLDLQL